MRRKLGISTSQEKCINEGEAPDMKVSHNPTRKPYIPPLIILLEAEDIRGGGAPVLEASAGLMAS